MFRAMLWVLRSNRVERLISAQIELLSKSIGGPLEMEWIGVGSPGIERRLSQEIARGLGVTAGIRFAPPGEILEQICRPNPETPSPFHEQVLTWSVFGVLPKLLDEPGFEPLRRYLPTGAPDTRRLGLARKIAQVFATYAHFRPEMVSAWEAGSAREAGEGGIADWQPVLWRALTAAHGEDHIARNASDFIARPEDRLRRLPFRRLSFFAVSAFSPLYVSVLSALASHMDVYLFVLSPSMEWWADALGGDGLNHPLAGALGRCGRDFQWVLEEYAAYLEPVGDMHEDPARAPNAGLLKMLQSDLLNLRSPKGRDASKYMNDFSLQVHSCTSPLRELEVIKDCLLDLFDRFDKELSPDDVAITAPNLSVYEPYLASVFGGESYPIPYHLASWTASAPTLRGFLRLLSAADGRLTVREVFDILAAEPVLRKFGLTSEDAVLLEEWVTEAGVRWGADKEHRAEVDQPLFDANTWRFGIDRLLLSLALSPEDAPLFDGRAPCVTLDTDGRERLERLLRFLQALFDAVDDWKRERTAADWGNALTEGLNALFERDEETEYEQQVICKSLMQWVRECEAARMTETLSFPAVRRFLNARLERLTGGVGMRPHGMTVAEMSAIRAVPFRVVCVLGLNESDYPGKRTAPGFDRTAERPKRGDRNTTDDDRYQFLELLLSAREAFVATYIGRDPQSGTVRAPSSVLSELAAAVKSGFGVSQGDLVQIHPASPYVADNFYLKNDPRRFSYASAALQGAPANRDVSSAIPAFWADPIPEDDAGLVINPDELASFLASPHEQLLRRRLGVSFPWTGRPADIREPMTSGRDNRQVERFLLERALCGVNPSDLEEEARAAGLLPLGDAGRVRFRRLCVRTTEFATMVERLNLGDACSPVSVDATLSGEKGSVRLVGAVDGIYSSGMIRFSMSPYTPCARADETLRFRASAIGLRCISGSGPVDLLQRRRRGALSFYAAGGSPCPPDGIDGALPRGYDASRAAFPCDFDSVRQRCHFWKDA